MVINCIIVEDEPLALKRTKEFVSQVSYLNVLSSFSNAYDAIGFLKTNTVDLIFLDIEMDGFTGIEFIESLTSKPQIIITTAYDKYALKGFSENLRYELREKGIKVTAVYPGAVMTESWACFDNSQNRIMEVSDIAEMIYTASKLSAQAVVENMVIRPQLGDL